MALQIRRGTSTQLVNFVPAEGELIYTTDIKKLYVGDGSTAGGLDVSTAGGIGGLLSASINLNGFNIVGTGNLNTTGSLNTTGNIQSSGTITASSFQGQLQGNVIGNLEGSVFGDLQGSVFGSDSSVLVDSINNQLTGPFTGNIVSPITQIVVLDNQAATPVFYGTVSGSVIGDLYGNIVGADSTIMFNSDTSTVVATGGITGPLFTDAVNAVSGTIFVESDFHIVGADAQTGSLVVQNTENAFIAAAQFETFSSTGANGGFVSFSSSRGDLTNRARLENGDLIYSLAFLSLGVGGADATAAFITAKVDGTTSDSIAPGALDFSVSNDIGIFNSALEIKSSALTVIKKGLSTDAGQDLANAGVVDLTTVSTFFTTSGPETATLAAGAEGQIKTFAAINVSAGDMTITVTNAAWAGAGTITFNQPAGCIIQYISSRWVCIGNNGALFA